MEKYESLSVVGEGSYGIVIKCRHKETGQLVAIKKFLETEDDVTVRKMALREIRMLKRLRHENLINMLEVFRRKKRFYLVFDYMDHTILDELDAVNGGLGEQKSKEHIFQVCRGIDFCHANNIIHRDVKPENVLVSSSGVVKLCDFGFARPLSGSGESYTDYVATRWYRAPELLVPDTQYGKPVDIWAIGCLFSEMMTGEPLFPGDSDIDQLFLIMKVMGKLSQKHQQLVVRNPMFKGLKRNEEGMKSLPLLFPTWPQEAIDFLETCLKMDPLVRPSSSDLLRHEFFMIENFIEHFIPELRHRILQDFNGNALFRKLQGSAPRRNREPIDVSEEKYKRSGLMEPPRWRPVGLNNNSRRTSIDQNREISSSHGGPMDTTEDTENRVEGRSAREGPVSLSPLQPLQTVIHPSINNLSLRNSTFKCSPVAMTTKLGNHSLLGRRNQITKRLERPFEATTIYAKNREPVTPSPTPWLAVKRGPSRDGPAWRPGKHHQRAGLDDHFSLPNLPGAAVMNSPKKGGKKKMLRLNVRDEDVNMTSPRNENTLTPSAGSKTRGHPSFPYMSTPHLHN